MSEETKKFDRAAAHLELWRYQSEQMWGRYPLLLTLQAAVFAAEYAVYFQDRKPEKILGLGLAIGVAVGGAILTRFLWICLHADRDIRDQHARWLVETEGFNPTDVQSEARTFESNREELNIHRRIFQVLILVDLAFALVAVFDAGWLAATQSMGAAQGMRLPADW